MNKCKNCGHKREVHAIAENHVLGTTHCAMIKCNCKEFIE